MKKVYCIECKFSSLLHPMTAVCNHKSNLTFLDNYYKIQEHYIKSASELNADNNCKNYKRKKF
jgi:hypothetical protein